MVEEKKHLRVAAGIIMLAKTLLSIAIQVAYYFIGNIYRHFGFFETYWTSLIGWIISIAIAVFVLCRLFRGAAITECVAALCNSFLGVGRLIIRYGYESFMTSHGIILLIGNLCSIAVTVMLIIGYFKHNAGSKKLFLIAAILAIVNNVIIGPTADTVLRTGLDYSSSVTVPAVLMNYGSGVLGAVSAALPLLLLAAYFGAQDKAPAAPRYMPTGNYPQSIAPPQNGAENRSVPPQQ